MTGTTFLWGRGSRFLLTSVLILLFLGSCAVRRGARHEIKSGQTLWRIAQVYDVKLDALLKVNHIEDPTQVRPGTTIVIPGAHKLRDVPVSPTRTARSDADDESRPSAGGRSSNSSSSSSSSSSNATASSGNSTSSEPPADDPPSDSRNESSTRASSRSDSTKTSRTSAGQYFDPVWPCEGRLASRFDAEKGPSHRGIRIHTSQGSLVKAAEEGNIKLAGSWDQMPELGKIVIIFHSHDFTTVYAHMKSLNVSEGETVERGEPIGSVGRTGNVDRPVCYFEVRYELEPRDPLIFLGEST